MMALCSDMDRAFAAVRSGQNCRAFLTPLVLSDINRCYQGDYLLSAAIEVYLRQSTSLENIKSLLDVGATPLCGRWNYGGVYLNEDPHDFTETSVRGTEMAAMVDDLTLLKALVTSTKCNELHLTCALLMARTSTESKKYLQEVLEQLQLVSPTLFRPYCMRSKPGLAHFLSLPPLAPVLILKKMEDENLRELLVIYREVVWSLRHIRLVFFNKESSASVLPLDVVKAATAYLVAFTPTEWARLQGYGKILEKGLLNDTYFSFVCGFRVQLPSKRQTRW